MPGKIQEKEILQEVLLGDLFFKKVSYVLRDYNTKKPIGLAFVCESSIQRNKVYVDVYMDKSENVIEDMMRSLNTDDVYFNQKIRLKDLEIKLKENFKYKIIAKFVFFDDLEVFE